MFKIKWNVRIMARLALLIAVEVALTRYLAYWTPDKTVKICGEFVAAALAAYLYGPLGGMIVAGMGDFIGATLFPVGAYNPAFTLTAMLIGLTLGLVYNNKKPIRGILAVLVTQILLKWILNTLWVALFISSRGFATLLYARLPWTVLLLAIWIPTILLIPKIGKRVKQD